MSLRVLLLSLNYSPEPTGIAPYATGLAEGLLGRGYDVSVLTTFQHYPEWKFANGGGRLTQRDFIGGVPVTRLRHFLPKKPTGFGRAVSELSFGARLVSQRWGQPDVIVSESPALLGAAMALCRKLGGRRAPAMGLVIQDLYSAGLVETAGGRAGVVRALGHVEGLTLRRVEGVAAIHPRMRSKLIEQFNLESDRVRVIRNWTHIQDAGLRDRGNTRRELGWRDDEFVVVHTGAMGEKQSLGNVVEAARLHDRNPQGLRFVLMGDGGQRRRLEEQARDVVSLDIVPPVDSAAYANVLAAADALLVNERAGLAEMAVPSKLTSYFSSRKPVLGAVNPGGTTAEEVAAAGAGLLVAPENPAALLEGALELAGDPDRCRMLGTRGREFCESVLSEEASLDAYASWVDQLAARRRKELAL